MSEWKDKYKLSSFWYWAWSGNPEVFIGIRFMRTSRNSFVVFGFLIGSWVFQRRRRKPVIKKGYNPPPLEARRPERPTPAPPHKFK